MSSPVPAALEAASKRYGDVFAVDRLDLAVAPGEIVALLGPNGAGKTTAVRMLLGLVRPTEGRASIAGLDPRAPDARRRFGAMLQAAELPSRLTVREQLEAHALGYPRAFPFARTIELAALDGLERRRFGTLSGGQKRRVFFALAICGTPDVLFLDEPTTGLDVETRRLLWRAVRDLSAGGTSVLLTTHYLEEADALAHRIVVIARGRAIAAGTPAEIKASAAPGRADATTLEDAYLVMTEAV